MPEIDLGFYRFNTFSAGCRSITVSVNAAGYLTQRVTISPINGRIYTLNFTLSPSTTVIPGDVNLDEQITIVDAMMVAQYSAGLNLVVFEPLAADVNGSSIIDILDALAIARYSAGLIPHLISVQPVGGPVGTQVNIAGSSFDSTNNEIRFTDPKTSIVYYNSIKVDSTDGHTLTFNIPASVHPYCYYDPMPCAAPDMVVQQGQYAISVITSKGESYSVPFGVH